MFFATHQLHNTVCWDPYRPIVETLEAIASRDPDWIVLTNHAALVVWVQPSGSVIVFKPKWQRL